VLVNTRLLALVSAHDSVAAEPEKLEAAAELYRDLLGSVRRRLVHVPCASVQCISVACLAPAGCWPVLYCNLLCSTVLYCVVLCCTVLYCVVLC
jgi:hypothetical protein